MDGTNTATENQLYNTEELDALRHQVIAIKEQTSLSWDKLAMESGIPTGTLSPFATGSYGGNNQKVAEKVSTWLISREEKAKARKTLRRSPEFVETPTAKAFLETLMFAQTSPEIVVIAGSPGVGKTMTAETYAARNTNVYYAPMRPSTAGVNTMMLAICEAMRIEERSPAKLSAAIGDKVRDTDALIILDDAQHLSVAALEQLRSFFDVDKVGIALIGNHEVYERLDGGKKMTFAQLFSRIGMRTNRSKPAARDVCMLLDAWKVPDKERTYLKQIAMKPGALRTVDRVLKAAHIAASSAGKPISEALVKAAHKRLSSTDDMEGA